MKVREASAGGCGVLGVMDRKNLFLCAAFSLPQGFLCLEAMEFWIIACLLRYIRSCKMLEDKVSDNLGVEVKGG